MPLATTGLHHVTAIARDAQRNKAFYVDLLGLRLIKRTINFDDRSTYHVYYGDATGRPGSIVTFFVRPDVEAGRRGTGQATAVRLSVPASSRTFWAERLTRYGVPFAAFNDGFEGALEVSDPDGLRIDLVCAADVPVRAPSSHRDVPLEYAIRGLHGVRLSVPAEEPTRALLMQGLGFVETPSGSQDRRFTSTTRGLGAVVDVHADETLAVGSIAAGSVHHVAFRAQDSLELQAWQRRLRGDGLDVTDVKDRCYFRSIYFHEPGGVRFEMATDGPGFTVDEPLDTLGTRLQLPQSLEAHRDRLEAKLAIA